MECTLLRYLLSLLLCCGSAHAIESDPIPEGVGLVLGGGGARGAAHIGVLKVLEREHIPVSHIAGTSMGSVVGAMYASGYSAAEIEKVVVTGELVIRGLRGAERREIRTYEMGFIVRDYTVLLDELRVIDGAWAKDKGKEAS